MSDDLVQINLDDKWKRLELQDRIKEDIDTFSQQLDDGFRSHLGASLIGHECERYLWYVFRWMYKKKHDGRLLRLFHRGKREETEFIRLLEGIGFTVESCDADGKQHRVSAVNGHFGGSRDGLLVAPARYGDLPAFLAEYKTKGTGSAFDSLDRNGVENDAAQHFIQMSVYGYIDGLQYALYIVVNKNDDSLIVEIVRLDWMQAKLAIAKAERIIYATEPPKRISDKPAFFKCKQCDMARICHPNVNGDKMPLARNCRSCVNATPVENADWYCNLWKQVIPQPADENGKRDHSHILAGCPKWSPLPS